LQVRPRLDAQPADDALAVQGRARDHGAGLRCLPHLHRCVPAPRGNAFAVGAARYAKDPIRMSLQRELFLARLRIPNLHLPVQLALVGATARPTRDNRVCPVNRVAA
jgi:hypothetical protein